MGNQKEGNFSALKSRGHSQSHSRVLRLSDIAGLSLLEMIELLKIQTDIDAFDKLSRESAENICRIAAEVLRLPDGYDIRIEGNKLPAEMVKEVYVLLKYEDIEAVLRKFENISYKIRNPKSYIRTALYNSVLDRNLSLGNEVTADIYGTPKAEGEYHKR